MRNVNLSLTGLLVQAKLSALTEQLAAQSSAFDSAMKSAAEEVVAVRASAERSAASFASAAGLADDLLLRAEEARAERRKNTRTAKRTGEKLREQAERAERAEVDVRCVCVCARAHICACVCLPVYAFARALSVMAHHPVGYVCVTSIHLLEPL